jgi:DNA-binding FadR family transcriptional regulator
MATKSDDTRVADLIAMQTAPIQTRGLPELEYPSKVIAKVMRERIEAGLFEPPNNAFPSISKLMSMAGTAKNTTRVAMDELRAGGWIETLAGLGTSVRPREKWNTTPEQRGE